MNKARKPAGLFTVVIVGALASTLTPAFAAPAAALTLTKAFASSTIEAFTPSPLTFTVTNTGGIPANASNVNFSDVLPAGLLVATPNGLTGSCGLGTITAVAGTNVISLAGGTLASGASCTFSVNVVANTTGAFTNTTGPIGGVVGEVTFLGATATASVFAIVNTDAPYQVRYAANLQFGESWVDIVNDGANGAPLLGPGLGGATGNLCVNVYAFDPNEEMISCCSCLVTPDQVRNIGVNRDITSNTATGVVPTSVTIKLLATLAGANGAGTSCTNAAAAVATAPVVRGYAAFGTTLHATTTSGSFATTESRFIPATLSAGELAHLANACSNIIGNLSGFGVCASCRNGALGAAAR